MARVATAVCAIPVEHVVETMRSSASNAIDGGMMHRGERVPVVDAAAIVGEIGSRMRCVVVRAGGGRAVLLVDEVLGVHRIERVRVGAMKAMFGERIEGVGAELRAVLGTVRVMDEVARG